MNKYNILLDKLKNKENFALSRFNDGEVIGMARPGSVVARGDQLVNPTLSKALIDAIKHEQEDYWVGLPCSLCWPEHFSYASNLVRKDYEYKTCAVVLTNRNWRNFIEEFPKTIQGRKVVWVSGEDQTFDSLSFKVDKSIFVKSKDGWSSYEDIKDSYKELAPNSIVILSCGPLSRVLAKEWFEKRQDLTILDVGSVWDPFTRDVWHNCHTGNLSPCKECN
jgi:hypothetical protein